MLDILEHASQPDQIQSLLRELLKETIDLPDERKERIEATIEKIRSCVVALSSTDGKGTPAAGEAKYREFAEFITDPFTLWDGDLRMVYRNKASAETTRLPDEQALGKTFLEIYPSLAGSEVHQAYLLALETHQPQRIRSHWVRPSDGSHLYHDLTVYPTSAGLCAISKNVTDQVHAEMSQQDALERAAWMARFPDENPHPVARVSVDGEILYGNRASANPSRWAFKVGEQIPASFLSLLEQANQQGKQVEGDIQVGEETYAVQFVPFPTEQYINIYGMDITERKRAEDQLRIQASIFEILYEPIIITDLQTVITFWNPAAERTFGWKEAEVIGKTTRDVLHTEISDQARAAAIRGLEEGKPAVTELLQHTKDNRALIVSGYTVPLRDTLGNTVGYAAVNWDITERKVADAVINKVNQDLIEERNRLQAVMEALPIGISILDRNGGLIQNNKGFDAVWSGPLPPTSSIEDYERYRAWWVETGQLVQPEEWASSLAVQRGETVTGQFIQIQRFDGSRAYVLNSGAPIWNAEGEIAGSAVAIMDISQWIEAENALRESEQRFRAAVRTASILVYECDRDQRYTWISNPFRGFRAEDVIGKRDDEILSPEAAEQIIAAKQFALDTGLGRTQEVKVPLNGEDTYYILTTDPMSDTKGNVIGLTCSVIDITEQKRKDLERQEQAIQIEVQRRLLEHREQDRNAMSRDLHDGPIQTLSSTLFHLKMIKDVFPDQALQTELDQIGMDIRNTVHELRDLMNDLRPPALLTFGFSKVIRLYIEDFRIRFPDLEIELDIVDDDRLLSSQVHLSLFRIFQAGINNIIRHSGANKAWVVYRIDEDSFCLELRDNGRGFEHNRDFSQLTRDGHFGLVGMKERAEAIEGEFSVSSEPGKGTTIIVKGPLNGANLK